ncbi:MAG TPA: hypothetical protein DEP46_11845 [Blastocatellia bacterium]|nr:hypothetical protein [Blastocatellia bacterium]
MFVPDGDRRYGTESGSVVNQKQVAIWNDDVVVVLILRDNFGNVLRMHFALWLSCRPSEHVREAAVTVDGHTISFAQNLRTI